MLDEQEQGAPDAELPRDLHRVARCPVLDDPAVLEAADDDPMKGDASPAMGSVKGPARDNSVPLADLFIDHEAEHGPKGGTQ